MRQQEVERPALVVAAAALREEVEVLDRALEKVDWVMRPQRGRQARDLELAVPSRQGGERQIPSDETAPVREPVREARRLAVQEEPRGLDRRGADTDDAR